MGQATGEDRDVDVYRWKLVRTHQLLGRVLGEVRHTDSIPTYIRRA